jgi:hypothetical protein
LIGALSPRDRAVDPEIIPSLQEMKQYRRTLLPIAVCLFAAGCFEDPSEPGPAGSGPGAAESVDRYSADVQSAVAGNAVTAAPAVIVKDADTQPLAGVPVRFVVTQGNGTVGVANAVTDQAGVADAGSWTLGAEPGANEVEARVAGFAQVRFTAMGVARGPTPLEQTVPTTGGFQIRARYLVTPSLRQQEAVRRAIGRWQDVIRADLTDILLSAPASACFSGQPPLQEVVDDILILVEFVNIDGTGKTLGEAGPCYVRSYNSLPMVGHLNLDVADLQQMETLGMLDDLVLHEIGHVLGFGTVWSDRNLLAGAGTTDPGFNGGEALGVYRGLGGLDPYVPVENTGGAGTRDAHWRESVFGSELMTGWLSQAPNPLSGLTIASLLDMGYGANPGAGSSYALDTVAQQSAARIQLSGREKVRKPRWKVNRQGKHSRIDLRSKP